VVACVAVHCSQGGSKAHGGRPGAVLGDVLGAVSGAGAAAGGLWVGVARGVRHAHGVGEDMVPGASSSVGRDGQPVHVVVVQALGAGVGAKGTRPAELVGLHGAPDPHVGAPGREGVAVALVAATQGHGADTTPSARHGNVGPLCRAVRLRLRHRQNGAGQGGEGPWRPLAGGARN
jgi:hypothetical protein